MSFLSNIAIEVCYRIYGIMEYMELYGILQLSPLTVTQLQQASHSPFIYSQMYRDILSRNYLLLRKYSKNYHGVPYKLFLNRVKNQAYEQRKLLKKKLNKENQHMQEGQLKNRGNSGKNEKLKPLMSSERYRMRMTMKEQENGRNIWKRMSLKIQQIASNSQKNRPKLTTHKQKQLNVVWLGQQDLLNNQKAQKYLNRWQNILLVRLNKKKSKIPELLNRKQMSMQENISVQINNYNISKFMSASGMKNRGHLQYFNA